MILPGVHNDGIILAELVTLSGVNQIKNFLLMFADALRETIKIFTEIKTFMQPH
jgi:hypothetical protein